MERNTLPGMVLFKTMKIGFVSRGNSIRSIFAEIIARELLKHAGIRAEVYSAGVEPDDRVHELTIRLLKERNFPAEGLRPKGIELIPYKDLDILVTIGNEAKERCEFVPSHKRREVWLIDEPKGGVDSFRRVFKDIEENLTALFKI
jgi:protein-tyrosine-phosphatase